MKRISILVLILSGYLVTAAWSQQPATRPPFGRHLQHRMARQTSGAPSMTASFNFAQASPDHAARVWELGAYPGGTWFSTLDVNNLGMLVGVGDVPPIVDGYGDTHTLALPLFGVAVWGLNFGHRRSQQLLDRTRRAAARCGVDQGDRMV